MSICPSCKAVIPDHHQFCQFCGTKISLDIALNILGEEALKPTSVPTHPLNLEAMLGEIKIQVEDFTSSQGASNIEQALEELDLEEPLLSFTTDVSPDLMPTEPMAPFAKRYLQNIIYAGKTDVGIQRDRNEDDFVAIFQTRSIHGKRQISARSHRGLFILCDGMGGHEGGAEASAIAVTSITDQFQPFWVDTLPGAKTIHEIIGNANQEIFARNESEQRKALGRMGTTLVLLAVHDLEVAIAHVGDSRIYKVTNRTNLPTDLSPNLPTDNLDHDVKSSFPKLEQITRDHEVLNQLLDAGMDLESALARPDSHQLTQAMGPNPSDRLEPAIDFLTLTEPTLFLLCSDGLCDNDAIEQHWQTHLLPILNQEIDLETGLDNLIELGNRVNGHDNLTAILVLCNLVAP